MLPKIRNTASFNAAIQEPTLAVIHFSADWAEQCAQVNELLEMLSNRSQFSDVRFYECCAEELPDISLAHNIEAVPVVILFRSGERLETIQGADSARITQAIRQRLDNTPSPELINRLQSLINRSRVMLFMKGDRSVPKCGFSRKIVEILNNTNCSYETFDILTDEEVRQGLKVYSNWPTYPQLYVNGDLIGGLDIIKEMLDSGDLAALLEN